MMIALLVHMRDHVKLEALFVYPISTPAAEVLSGIFVPPSPLWKGRTLFAPSLRFATVHLLSSRTTIPSHPPEVSAQLNMLFRQQ